MQNNVTWFHYNRKQATEKQQSGEDIWRYLCWTEHCRSLFPSTTQQKKTNFSIDTPFIHINKMTTAQQMSALY